MALLELERRVAELERGIVVLQSHVRQLMAERVAVAYNQSTNAVWTRSDLLFRHFINCTAACSITLPMLETGEVARIRNTGTHTLTIKDEGGADVGTVEAGASGSIGSDGADIGDLDI
jgi:hypothetical protein